MKKKEKKKRSENLVWLAGAVQEKPEKFASCPKVELKVQSC